MWLGKRLWLPGSNKLRVIWKCPGCLQVSSQGYLEVPWLSVHVQLLLLVVVELVMKWLLVVVEGRWERWWKQSCGGRGAHTTVVTHRGTQVGAAYHLRETAGRNVVN